MNEKGVRVRILPGGNLAIWSRYLGNEIIVERADVVDLIDGLRELYCLSCGSDDCRVTNCEERQSRLRSARSDP